MGGFNIEMSQKGKEMFKELGKLGRSIDLRMAFFLIGIAYRKEVRAIFERKQARPNVKSWEKLDPVYARYRTKKYGARPILNLTGWLKDSMTSRNHPQNIEVLGKLRGTFGTKVKYARYHDEGTGTMPKRNFSIPSTNSHKTYRKIFEEEVARQLKLGGIAT